ncbi:hypothetical protein HKX48_003338 [Thoreauomyces humboldtii]|nr:hypothetical protein HKX48_003338 [Thoreauomyces humboldtii]
MGRPGQGPSSYGGNPNVTYKKQLGLQKKQNNPGISKKHEMIRRTKFKKQYHNLLKHEGLDVGKVGGSDAAEGGGDGSDEEEIVAGDDGTGEKRTTEPEYWGKEREEGRELAPRPDLRRRPKAAASTTQHDPSGFISATLTSSSPGTGSLRKDGKAQGRGKGADAKAHRPNPYAKMVAEAEQRKLARQAAFDEARRLKDEQNSQRKQYYTNRNNTRVKLQMKTRKGQPVMANQISHLLDKIQGKK